jgi:hypothetical protein
VPEIEPRKGRFYWVEKEWGEKADISPIERRKYEGKGEVK